MLVDFALVHFAALEVLTTTKINRLDDRRRLKIAFVEPVSDSSLCVSGIRPT